MKYCILITLSQHTISFHYYRSDGKDCFLPFDSDVSDGSDCVLPLAISCQGTEFQIGQYAEAEAIKSSPNAFRNIFELSREHRTFNYAGENRRIDELLFMAIQDHINRNFFERTLYNQEGSLDNNRKRLPLLLMFHPSMDDSSRIFVRSQFSKSGYANMQIFDYNQELAKDLYSQPNSSVKGKKLVFLSFSRNDNLYLEIIDKDKKLCSKCYVGLGKDARVKYGMDRLWLSFPPTYAVREDEEAILEKTVKAFLASDLEEFNDYVTLSNGDSVPGNLFKKDFKNLQVKKNNLTADVLAPIKKLEIPLSECILIIRNQNVKTAQYFREQLSTVGFSDIRLITEKVDERLMSGILQYAQSRNFVFENYIVEDTYTDIDTSIDDTDIPEDNTRETSEGHTAGDVVETTTEKPETPEPPAEPAELPVGPKPVIPSDLKRRVKKTINEAKAFLKREKFDLTRKTIKAILDELHNDNIHFFDEELEKILADCAEAEKTAEKAPDGGTDTGNGGDKDDKHQEPEGTITPAIKRQVNIAIKEIQMFVKRNDLAKANKTKKEILSLLHAQNIHSLDESVENALKVETPEKPSKEGTSKNTVIQTGQNTKKSTETKKPHATVVQSKPKDDPYANKRNRREAIAEIKAKVRKKELKGAKSMLVPLLKYEDEEKDIKELRKELKM